MAKKKTTSKSSTKWVKITGPVAGRFLLPYNIDQEVSLETKQADELIETGYAVDLENIEVVDATNVSAGSKP
tara:strand:+ start:74 stop:289 length:216 start_codon:yes stop_codon:yes gene_type:complete